LTIRTCRTCVHSSIQSSYGTLGIADR
jgi:hypothetical protein